LVSKEAADGEGLCEKYFVKQAHTRAHTHACMHVFFSWGIIPQKNLKVDEFVLRISSLTECPDSLCAWGPSHHFLLFFGKMDSDDQGGG
jgi:hypothetical protein